MIRYIQQIEAGDFDALVEAAKTVNIPFRNPHVFLEKGQLKGEAQEVLITVLEPQELFTLGAIFEGWMIKKKFDFYPLNKTP